VRAKISPFLPSPNNIENNVRAEMRELLQVIQNQTRLIENLYETIEKLAAK
ncbi:MAG: peptidase S24, partial [Bacteroidetes bacterium]|nr:peptidase S24 [Bacteroidota bacterium]